MNWQHLFIPHRETHKKAHLISWHGMLIYILLFMLMQVGFSIYGNIKPGVLGVNSNINQQVVIQLTNREREKLGLPALAENSELDSAAEKKAQNMFAENYWAHFAPSGKSPWDFISGSGYKFVYAGENLAKNFYTSGDVVAAWMASPSHKENIVNTKYRDIGIAVVDGVLNGQKTTLVVQEFGTTPEELTSVGAPSIDVGGKVLEIPVASQPSLQLQEVESANTTKIPSSTLDQYQVYKGFGVGVLVLMSGLLGLDFIVLKRRGVYRMTSHHVANFSFMAAGAITILQSHPGGIL